MKKLHREKCVRRGNAFVDEPTGSATQVNLDGETEHCKDKNSGVTNQELGIKR